MSAGALEYAKAGVKSNVIPGECRVKLRGKKEILVLGRQGHAGYPHLYENAIEKALKLLMTIPSSNERGKCELVFDLRTIPEEDLDSADSAFKKYVKKINPEAELEIQEKKEGYVLSEAHPFVRMLKNATGEKNAYGEFGGTDAPFFCGRGIPSICFGPISYESNIHGKDEFVKIKDLEFVSNSIVKLCENWKTFKYPKLSQIHKLFYTLRPIE
jgi:acetylornithine deacetylase/succinyl-diaminopimelate desuccinylase-like protein